MTQARDPAVVPYAAAYATKLTLAALVLLLRPDIRAAVPGSASRPAPKWMAALDSFTPVKPAGLGTARGERLLRYPVR